MFQSLIVPPVAPFGLRFVSSFSNVPCEINLDGNKCPHPVEVSLIQRILFFPVLTGATTPSLFYIATRCIANSLFGYPSPCTEIPRGFFLPVRCTTKADLLNCS